MKTKNIFLALVFIAFGSASFAQGLYVKADFGYGMPTGTQTIMTNNTITANTDIEEPIHVSLGKGIDFNGAVGYSLTDNLSAELNIIYHSGVKFTSTIDDQTRPRITETTLSGSYLGFAPMFKLSGEWLGVMPFAKFGFVAGIPNVKSTYNRTDNNIIIRNWKESGNLSLGLVSEFGIEYGLNDNMALTFSFRSSNMSYSPAKGELTESTVDGADITSQLTTSQKQTEYVKEIDWDINQLNGNPSQELVKKYPFSSAAIAVGIKITL